MLRRWQAAFMVLPSTSFSQSLSSARDTPNRVKTYSIIVRSMVSASLLRVGICKSCNHSVNGSIHVWIQINRCGIGNVGPIRSIECRSNGAPATFNWLQWCRPRQLPTIWCWVRTLADEWTQQCMLSTLSSRNTVVLYSMFSWQPNNHLSSQHDIVVRLPYTYFVEWWFHWNSTITFITEWAAK